MSSRADNSLLARMMTENWQQQVSLASITTTPTELKNWADAYKFLSAAAKLWMASTDETNDVGIGIKIKGLIEDPDNNNEWIEAGETVLLDAVDARIPVETVNTYIRINKVSVVGSTPLTGILNLADEDTATWSAGAPGTGTNRVGYIAAGEKESNMMIFSTPARANGKVLELYARADAAQSGFVDIQVNRYDGFGFVSLDQLPFPASEGRNRVYEIPLRVYPQSDIKILGASDASTTDIVSRIGMALH